MSELTYYQKNKDVILNRTKYYYKNNKGRLRQRVKDKYKTYPMKKKIKRENMEKIDIIICLKKTNKD